MPLKTSGPLLRRVKSWQLVSLGIAGWCALYSVAILTWGTCSSLIGNAQGGCFAATMTLASLEARRARRGDSRSTKATPWEDGISTEQLNHLLAQTMQKRDFRVEACQDLETQLGFGIRAINAGRTMVFETARWKEPVIDLHHAQATEENRKTVHAELAIIVGAGRPDEAASGYIKTRPLRLLVGDELKTMVNAEKPVAEEPVKKTS